MYTGTYMQHRKSSWIGSLLFSVALLAGVALLWFQRFEVYDWWRLRNYTPPAAVQQLATDTTMNGRTQKMFFAYHPSLEDQGQFNLHCGDNERTIVLGCYVLNRGIYLYNVKDDRLKGVLQVTAAHETLHAAYDRLSIKERTRVDALTAQAYAGISDERLRSTIEAYRSKDPSIVPNELHSILATEVRNLPAPLEEYYKRYFINRGAIVAFSEQYENEFTGRKQQVIAYDQQLKDLKAQIEALESNRENELVRINAETNRLQALRRGGDIEAYNAGVPNYQALVRAYNAAIRQEQSLINQYNEIVKIRNALAVEENQLIKAIDSRTQDQLTPQQ